LAHIGSKKVHSGSRAAFNFILVSLPVPETQAEGISFASQFVCESEHRPGFKRSVGLVSKDKIIVLNRGIVCLEASLDIGISVVLNGNEAYLAGENFVLNK